MELLFIYNANSGSLQALLVSAHKIIQPDTYTCKLCTLTHGIVQEKEEWRKFKAQSAHTFTMLHKDEFIKHYGSKWLPKYEFPCILSKDDGGITIFMRKEAFDALDTVSDLINTITYNIEHWRPMPF